MTFILDRFLSLFNGGMKAYKVQDVKREQRIGVTAKNFKELLEKGAEKLKARFALWSCKRVSLQLSPDGKLMTLLIHNEKEIICLYTYC